MRTGTKTQRRHASGSSRSSLLLVVLVSLAFSSIGLFQNVSAQELEVQVEQCEDNGTCSTDTQTAAPEPQQQPEEVVVPVAPAPAPEETHDYDLRSGQGTVQRDGKVQEETLELDLSQKHEEAEAEEHGQDDHEHADVDDLLDDDAGMPTVTTTGGGGFAGFGADFISGDEALSRFAVPPFLIPIYVAAGRAYDVPWNVLAAINQIETDFGRIRHQVSYAGATGWMQFMPGTWKAYGVDASGDGVADPFNPVDAIYAAARYLKASGAPHDMRRAVFAYNHADWYVDRVLKTASIYGSLPSGLLAETGSLAFGRFPLLGQVSYGDDFRRDQAAGRRPDGLWISGQDGADAVATQNVKVVEILLDRKLAGALTDRRSLSARGVSKPAPTRVVLHAAGGMGASASHAVAPSQRDEAGLPKGYARSEVQGVGAVVEDSLGNRYSYEGLQKLRPGTRPGAELEGGDVIGEVGARKRLLFSVEAAGGAPVDPRPLVDGYRLQEVADFYNAVAPLGGNPFVAEDATSIEGVTGTQRALAQKVLNDSGIDIYPAGREDISHGVIDKRILGTLLYLRRNGIDVTVTSLRSGHGFYTAGGSISAHSFGAAVDIAAFNGQPVIGHQGPGSLTEQAIKLLMRLEGDAQPAQLISLMNLGGPSFAMGDHHDHLHVGYHFEPSLGSGRSGNVLGSVQFDGGTLSGGLFGKDKVDPRHEEKLSNRLGKIENPEVRGDRGPGSLHVEAEALNERRAAQRLAKERRSPLAVQPAAAGARLIDLDIPSGTREGWAIGTVDGASQEGWAHTQTVLVRFAGGSWQVVGPIEDSAGRIVNPTLRALSTVAGGKGYAVGDKGAVVRLRGQAAPVLLPARTQADLKAVDAGQSGGGYAVGERGFVLKLDAGRVTVERAGESTLEAVTLDSAGALAGGAGDEDAALYRRDGSGWHELGADFGVQGLRTRVTDLESGDDGLWLAGGISDSAAAGAAELPFAAHLAGGQWTTYCAGRPALAAVAELGTPTERKICSEGLSSDPSDSGAASAIALTRHGAVVATARALYLRGEHGFQPLDGRSSGFQSLALTAAGRGWALAEDGELAYVRPLELGDIDRVEEISRAGAADYTGLARSADGEQVLVLNGDAGVTAAAFQDEDTAWGTDETGALLKLEDGKWSEHDQSSIYGLSSVAGNLREALADALGGTTFSPDDPSSELPVRSFAFAPSGDGLAAGGSSNVIRLHDDHWSVEDTPATVPLYAVAATDDVAVAAGEQGTLVEDSGDGWSAPDEPRELAGGRDFSAADALSDGTILAVAGGLVLERSAEGDWSKARLDPLGVRVRKLSGYRTESGELRAVALVTGGDELALLEGDSRGWHGVGVPSGLRVEDFNLERDSGRLTVVGYRDGSTVSATTEVTDR